jgi:hypothetical protein
MGTHVLNIAKEFKKNKFGMANYADTIQSKSLDGLQNHADTQKLIRIKNASEQTNHQEKIAQLKSMGDTRAQKIQHGDVTQLMLRTAGTRILGAGVRAAEAGVRNAPRIAKAGAKLTGGLAVADQMSGAATGYLMNDKNKFAKHSFSLAESAIGKMKIPVTVKSVAEDIFKTLAEEAETFPFDETTPFDDSQNQIISESIRELSSVLDENDIPNPIAAFISMDNIQSRFFALAEVAKNKELELILGRMRFDEEFERGRVAPE